MPIAVLGSGRMARAMSGLFVRSSFDVTVSSRESARAEALASSLGGKARAVPLEAAAAGADLAVLATGWDAARETLERVGPLSGSVLLDCTNPESSDGRTLLIGTTTSGAETIASWVPGARVVKAFNHVYAEVLDRGPGFGAAKASVFHCGDDPEAGRLVADLIAFCGFVPVDAGPLRSARHLEAMAVLLVELVRGGGRPPGGAAFALLERAPD